MPKYKDWLQDDKLVLLQAWARNGLTNEQIASNMGIVLSTFYRWQKDYKEFSNAIKKGKEVVDIEVENALLKRAMGYQYVETTKERVPVYESDTGNKIIGYTMAVTKEVTKDMPGDVGAQFIWLKNRLPNIWRDKHEIQQSGEITVTINNTLQEYAK